MKIIEGLKSKISITKTDSKAILFALKELISNLSSKGIDVDLISGYGNADIVIVDNLEEAKKMMIDLPSELKKEGYQIVKKEFNDRIQYYILAIDEVGAMYGTFEFSDYILANDDVSVLSKINNPSCEFRAIKINLPWSSYREGESLEIHRTTMKTIRFWEKLLDMMIKSRLNVLTIWSLHPFSFMIKSKSFPLATPYTDEELKEWKMLWSSIFKMAKERGIETYILNWNIFVSESFKKNYDNKAVSEVDGHYAPYTYHSDIVDEYLRESVTQLIDEYEDLTGFGVSLGERMVGMTPKSRQEWIENIYYKAIKNAKREIKFIHRAAFSVSPEVTRKSIENSDLPKPVYVELKFNWSHAYSTTDLLVTHGGSTDIDGYWIPEPKDYKMVWMARNEDFFTLRWAQADYVREHINKNMANYVAGYFIGSECYIPAYDYSHIKGSDHINWEYAFEKNWLYYLIWGRLLYNPEETDDVFIKALERQYAKNNAKNLFLAYSYACKMPMALATFHNFDNDWSLYSEGFLATKYQLGYNKGEAFISIVDLLECNPIDPNWLSVNEYVENLLLDKVIPSKIKTPLDISEELMKDAIKAETYLSKITDIDKTLECEVLDIKAWIYLSKYFSLKLKAAISLQLFIKTKVEHHKKQAIEYLNYPNAIKYWEDLVMCTKIHYVDQPLMQIEQALFSWEIVFDEVKKDIKLVEDIK